MRVNLPFLNSSFICLEEKEDDIFFFFVKVDRTVTALISSYPNKVAEASRLHTSDYNYEDSKTNISAAAEKFFFFLL